MNENERFAKLAGIQPVYVKEKRTLVFPDFTDSREVLKVMMAREDWVRFVDRVGAWLGGVAYIHIIFIMEPGNLRDLATEWMEGRLAAEAVEKGVIGG